ncbi:hypothetical protein AKJ62_04905, partial [candidate division MSBL1 archaeon SCGC-AAA259D14]
MEDKAKVEIKGLKKVYKGENPVTAIEDISFNVEEGDFVSIVGPSGCGKSTLLKIVAGILEKTEGNVKIDGRDVKGPTRECGMVFQKPVLFEWRTNIENVLLPCEIHKENLEKKREEAISLLELVGLEDFMEQRPSELSGGMQQRVSICRSLIMDPEVLLMDEPFGALDYFTREQMNLELLRIWRKTKKSILFVTHNIEEAVFLGDKV